MQTNKARAILNPSSLLALDTKPFERIQFALKSQGRPRFHAMMSALAGCLENDEIFLEVGTYQGGSMIGTLMGNHARGWSVEDFSEFAGNTDVDNTRKRLMGNLIMFGMEGRVTINQMRFETFFEEVKIPPVGLYYYDANHGESATLEGLRLGFPHVIPGGFLVVDDVAFPEVSTGVNRFIGKFPDELKIIYCANMTIVPSIDLDPDWWNGVMVMQKVSK
jgi:protein O-GlcNAc transferase